MMKGSKLLVVAAGGLFLVAGWVFGPAIEHQIRVYTAPKLSRECGEYEWVMARKTRRYRCAMEGYVRGCALGYKPACTHAERLKAQKPEDLPGPEDPPEGGVSEDDVCYSTIPPSEI